VVESRRSGERALPGQGEAGGGAEVEGGDGILGREERRSTP
jgi:hypothetical protein